MKITSQKIRTAHLTPNEEALLRCEAALELKDRGDYEKAREALGHLWVGLGERPEVKGLHASVAAEVLLCVGNLTGWLASRRNLKEGQETAKDLITEGITFYESIHDAIKIAAARVELARCYWRQGELNEARTLLTEALQKLTTGGNTRAKALILLSTVEWTASRPNIALNILTENSSLFEKLSNHATKGNYHNELAIVFRHLANAENKFENLRKAVAEFQKADTQFKLARNRTFRASVKNNVGLLLFNLSRFREAHKYLEQARRLTSNLRDKVRTAQVDDTRAQVFIAEKKFKEAEAVARNAVRNLEKSGHQCLLTDALITHGIALARLKRAEPAQFVFQKAIEVAHQVGALNKAGIAALTMIEELDTLPPDALHVAYDRASEWLAKSQSQDLLLRLTAAARKVIATLRTQKTMPDQGLVEDPIEAILNKPCDLQSEILKFEGSVIKRALAKANGSLTRAAALLSMSYQALAYILESRQKDLLNERTPIRRRARRETATTADVEQS
jgi:tetratricopeptide (TPR) repeat protein